MEVFFFLIYHHNTAPQKAGGQDTHSDCKSPELVWRLKLWLQPQVPLPAFPGGPQPWCVCQHSGQCVPGLTSALGCLRASVPLLPGWRGQKINPGASRHTWSWVLLPGTEGGREDTQHRIPPMARATLQLLPHKDSLLCPWQGDVLLQTPQVAGVVFCPQGGTRAILAAVQAHIITYLLFTRETESTHLDR